MGVSPVPGPHLGPPSRVGSCQNSPVTPRNKKPLGVNHIETKQVCQNQSRPLNPPGLWSPCLSRETAPRSGGAAQTSHSRSPGPLPPGSLRISPLGVHGLHTGPRAVLRLSCFWSTHVPVILSQRCGRGARHLSGAQRMGAICALSSGPIGPLALYLQTLAFPHWVK